MHPNHVKRESCNAHNPYRYLDYSREANKVINMADKIIIHLPGGGQFIAKDRYRTGYLGAEPRYDALPPVKTHDPVTAYMVSVATAPVAAVVIGALCNASNGAMVALVVGSIALVSVICLGHSAGEGIGCLPDDGGTDRPHGA